MSDGNTYYFSKMSPPEEFPKTMVYLALRKAYENRVRGLFSKKGRQRRKAFKKLHEISKVRASLFSSKTYSKMAEAFSKYDGNGVGEYAG
jgi:hypothetical protein